MALITSRIGQPRLRAGLRRGLGTGVPGSTIRHQLGRWDSAGRPGHAPTGYLGSTLAATGQKRASGKLRFMPFPDFKPLLERFETASYQPNPWRAEVILEDSAGKGSGLPFIKRVRALVADGPLQEVTEALLLAWQALNDQIAILSRRLITIARTDQAVKRLMTAPGVGTLVALTYISVIDYLQRFAKSSSVGAYIGLTPRRFQSGQEDDGTGHISRCGDKLLRTYLFEAAGIILHRVAKWSALKGWGTRLAKRIVKTATVAVARKLAGILHRMLRDGLNFAGPPRKVSPTNDQSVQVASEIRRNGGKVSLVGTVRWPSRGHCCGPGPCARWTAYVTSRGRRSRHHHAAAHADRGENHDPTGMPIKTKKRA